MKKILISKDVFGNHNDGFLKIFTSNLNRLTFGVNEFTSDLNRFTFHELPDVSRRHWEDDFSLAM